MHSVTLFRAPCGFGWPSGAIGNGVLSAIMGIDIDAQAIRKGNEYLKQHSSKAVLAQRDIENHDRILVSRTFYLFYAAGVPR